MDIQSAYLERNSAQEFSKKLSTYLASGAGLLHVRTEEIMRALTAIRMQLLGEEMYYTEWDIVSGFREFTLDTLHNHALPGDGNQDLSAALSQPLEILRDGKEDHDTHQAFVYVNPHPFMDNNPHLNQLLMQYAELLPATSFYVILVTPDRPLPENTTPMLSIEFKPPGLTELRGALNEILDGVKDNFTVNLAEEELDKVCYVGAGMTKNNFQMYASLATCQIAGTGKEALTVEDLIEGVSVGKTDIIAQNDLLELYPSGKMSNVGGLENLKAWVRKRAKCYSDEAREFGVEPPKGLILIGIPGSGKSAMAKAIANEMGVPCVRLDFGRVFNSLVGASEQRMRTALKMVEAIAPAILFCDELEKGLAGAGGSGDSGVSTRVVGTLLTWLSDNTAPVFVVATCNNVAGLPPELLRRGRFDAIFSTTLPTAKERKEVLAIHLRLRNRDIKDFTTERISAAVNASEGYVPAEIESAVKDGLVDAFAAGQEFTLNHVIAALQAMVPLSKSFAAQIKAMQDWAQANAISASAPEDDVPVVSSSVRRRAPRILTKGTVQ